MVDHNSCEKKLKTTRLGNHFTLDKSFNCAGGEKNIDVCTGDGGGPLMCPGKNSVGESMYFQVIHLPKMNMSPLVLSNMSDL